MTPPTRKDKHFAGFLNGVLGGLIPRFLLGEGENIIPIYLLCSLGFYTLFLSLTSVKHSPREIVTAYLLSILGSIVVFVILNRILWI